MPLLQNNKNEIVQYYPVITIDEISKMDDLHKSCGSHSISNILSDIQKNIMADIKGTAKSQSVMERFAKGFKNPKDLYFWLKNSLNLQIPYKINCGNMDHCSPFKFVSDIIFRKTFYALIWACRGGGKSYNAGLINWLLANLYPMFDGKVLGGSEDQAMKSYEAMLDLWTRAGEHSTDVLVGGQQNRLKAQWKNGSIISILAASAKKVRGPHPTSLMIDEADEVDWKIYEAAQSQPQSKHGIPASMLLLSTYHNTTGTMARLFGDTEVLEDDDDGTAVVKKDYLKGVTIYRYCIMEILESCRDYICSTCPISSICPGVHMKNAVGYYKIQDLSMKLQLMSKMTFETEWLCKKPSRKGLIFENYDESIHTLDIGYNPELPVDISIDFGFSQGQYYCIGAYQDYLNHRLSDGRKITGTVMFDEIYTIPKTNAEMINLIKTKPWARYPGQVVGVADSSRKSLITEWRQAGFRVRGVNKNLMMVEEGIQKVLDLFLPVAGQPKLYIGRKCKGFLMEKDNYKWGLNGKPLDEYNHSADQLRYRVMVRNYRKRLGKPIVL